MKIVVNILRNIRLLLARYTFLKLNPEEYNKIRIAKFKAGFTRL